MNTKSLAVGQEVYLSSGVYTNSGTVVEVTPNGVVVREELRILDRQVARL